jgi:MOSC domain-containing protein YiiM
MAENFRPYICIRPEHLQAWADELGTSNLPGTFGENLTVTDLTEQDVHVGDEFMWGGVLLQVTKPRRPCYKLPIHLGIDAIAKQMMRNGRCGWYCEVKEPGTVKLNSGLELVGTSLSAPTIADVFEAKVRNDPTVPDMPVA